MDPVNTAGNNRAAAANNTAAPARRNATRRVTRNGINSVTRYIVVSEDSLKKLTDAVNHKITRGYVPQGGVSISGSGVYHYFIQVMVKY